MSQAYTSHQKTSAAATVQGSSKLSVRDSLWRGSSGPPTSALNGQKRVVS